MLCNGITGFIDLNEHYMTEQDKNVFKKFCYSIANKYRCEIILFDLELASKNFYYAKIKNKYSDLYLLENAYYPYIAFAKKCEFAGIEFIENPFNLKEYNVHILTLSELRNDWYGLSDNLGKTELEQINYWKPKTIGDIIFNFWD